MVLFFWPCARVFVLCEHMAFVLVFCVPCNLMSIVLTSPILLPDYWLICPTCLPSLPSSMLPLLSPCVAIQYQFVIECFQFLPCPALSCLVLSCLVLSCLVLSCLVLSCLVLSCLVLSCLALPCLALPCLASCPVFPYGVVLICLFYFIINKKPILLNN